MTIQLFTTPHKLAKLSYALFRETLLQSAGPSWDKRQVMSSTLATVSQVRVRSLEANLGPHPNSDHATLADALHFLKLSFTKRLPGLTGETGSFWQKRYYDRNVRDEDEFKVKLLYLHRNPVKRGLVTNPADWNWSSFRHYALREVGAILP